MALLDKLRNTFRKTTARVTIVVYAPENTPAGATICLTGDAEQLGQWDAAGKRMVQTGPGEWQATIRVPSQSGFEFKATRGTWESVERHADGGDTANHFVPAESFGQGAIYHTVERWSDLD